MRSMAEVHIAWPGGTDKPGQDRARRAGTGQGGLASEKDVPEVGSDNRSRDTPRSQIHVSYPFFHPSRAPDHRYRGHKLWVSPEMLVDHRCQGPPRAQISVPSPQVGSNLPQAAPHALRATVQRATPALQGRAPVSSPCQEPSRTWFSKLVTGGEWCKLNPNGSEYPFICRYNDVLCPSGVRTQSTTTQDNLIIGKSPYFTDACCD